MSCGGRLRRVGSKETGARNIGSEEWEIKAGVISALTTSAEIRWRFLPLRFEAVSVRKVEAFFDKRKMNSNSLMCWIRYHLIFKQQYKAWKNCSIVLCIQESDPLTVWSSTSTTATIEAKFDQQREGQGIHGYYRLIFSEWNKSDIEALHFATFTCSSVRNLWSAQPHGMSWWRFCDW